MPVDVWVSHPLLDALHTLPPYPLDAHVDVVLHSIWGTDLPELTEQATRLQQTASLVDRSVNTCFNQRPTTRSMVYALGGCTLRAYHVRPGAGPIAQLLLPVDTTDQFRLQTEDMFGETELYVERPGVLSCNRRITGSYAPLRDWALMLHSLCTDMVEAHKLLTATAAASKRVFPDVLRSVYPSAARVFPELNYHKRSPISPQWLRRWIHPADQAMIRTVLDKAAAGRDAPSDQKTLSGPSLGYHEE